MEHEDERLEGQVQRSDTAAFESLQDRIVALEERADISRLEARLPKNAHRDSQEGHFHNRLGRLNVRPPRELTIGTPAAGLVQMTRGYHTIDTASDASTDNLAGILGGRPGEVIWIQPDNDARTIVVKHNDTSEGTDGNRIFLNGGSDIHLDSIEDLISLMYDPAADSANGAWRDYPVITSGPWTCRDYLVDKDYIGTEGATITTQNTTHTFKIFSTVEGATDDGIANLSRAFSVEICAGTYVEDLEIPDFSHEIHLYGSGMDATIIGGNTVSSHDVKTTTVYFYDLTLTGPAAGFSLTSGASQNCQIHASNVIFRRRMAGDHSLSEFHDCLWPAGIQFESGDTPDSVLISGGVLSSTTGLDFTVATAGKDNWDVRGLRMNTQATLKLRQVSNSRFDIHFETDGGALNDQVAFTNENSNGIELNCLFAEYSDNSQAINVASGITVENLQVRGIARYGAGISNNATRWFDNDGIVVGAHIDVSFRKNGSGNRLEDDITGPSIEGDFRESKFTLVPTDVEVKTTGSSTANVVDAGTIQSGSTGITAGITHDLLSVTHPDTLAASVVRGDVLAGNSTPAFARLALGADHLFLGSNGTDPLYRTVGWDILLEPTGTNDGARIQTVIDAGARKILLLDGSWDASDATVTFATGTEIFGQTREGTILSWGTVNLNTFILAAGCIAANFTVNTAPTNGNVMINTAAQSLVWNIHFGSSSGSIDANGGIIAECLFEGVPDAGVGQIQINKPPRMIIRDCEFAGAAASGSAIRNGHTDTGGSILPPPTILITGCYGFTQCAEGWVDDSGAGRSSALAIVGNVIEQKGAAPAVDISLATAVITSNFFQVKAGETTGASIINVSGGRAMIINNTLLPQTIRTDAIDIGASSGNVISGNLIEGEMTNAIHLAGSGDKNIVSNNNCADETITIASGSTGNVIALNRAQTITGSTADNQIGLNITGS